MLSTSVRRWGLVLAVSTFAALLEYSEIFVGLALWNASYWPTDGGLLAPPLGLFVSIPMAMVIRDRSLGTLVRRLGVAVGTYALVVLLICVTNGLSLNWLRDLGELLFLSAVLLGLAYGTSDTRAHPLRLLVATGTSIAAGLWTLWSLDQAYGAALWGIGATAASIVLIARIVERRGTTTNTAQRNNGP